MFECKKTQRTLTTKDTISAFSPTSPFSKTKTRASTTPRTVPCRVTIGRTLAALNDTHFGDSRQSEFGCRISDESLRGHSTSYPSQPSLPSQPILLEDRESNLVATSTTVAEPSVKSPEHTQRVRPLNSDPERVTTSPTSPAVGSTDHLLSSQNRLEVHEQQQRRHDELRDSQLTPSPSPLPQPACSPEYSGSGQVATMSAARQQSGASISSGLSKAIEPMSPTTPPMEPLPAAAGRQAAQCPSSNPEIGHRGSASRGATCDRASSSSAYARVTSTSSFTGTRKSKDGECGSANSESTLSGKQTGQGLGEPLQAMEERMLKLQNAPSAASPVPREQRLGDRSVPSSNGLPPMERVPLESARQPPKNGNGDCVMRSSRASSRSGRSRISRRSKQSRRSSKNKQEDVERLQQLVDRAKAHSKAVETEVARSREAITRMERRASYRSSQT